MMSRNKLYYFLLTVMLNVFIIGSDEPPEAPPAPKTPDEQLIEDLGILPSNVKVDIGEDYKGKTTMQAIAMVSGDPSLAEKSILIILPFGAKVRYNSEAFDEWKKSGFKGEPKQEPKKKDDGAASSTSTGAGGTQTKDPAKPSTPKTSTSPLSAEEQRTVPIIARLGRQFTQLKDIEKNKLSEKEKEKIKRFNKETLEILQNMENFLVDVSEDQFNKYKTNLPSEIDTYEKIRALVEKNKAEEKKLEEEIKKQQEEADKAAKDAAEQKKKEDEKKKKKQKESFLKQIKADIKKRIDNEVFTKSELEKSDMSKISSILKSIKGFLDPLIKGKSIDDSFYTDLAPSSKVVDRKSFEGWMETQNKKVKSYEEALEQEKIQDHVSNFEKILSDKVFFNKANPTAEERLNIEKKLNRIEEAIKNEEFFKNVWPKLSITKENIEEWLKKTRERFNKLTPPALVKLEILVNKKQSPSDINKINDLLLLNVRLNSLTKSK